MTEPGLALEHKSTTMLRPQLLSTMFSCTVSCMLLLAVDTIVKVGMVLVGITPQLQGNTTTSWFGRSPAVPVLP